MKQDPKEGEFRKGDNTVIQVWVSAGEDIGTMIDVTNMTYAAAKVELKSLIEQYDLELVEPTEEEYVYSDKVTENYIISTDPAAEEPLKKGDTIHFVISKGPEIKQVPVPQFVGKQIDQVLEEVKELNLTCNAEDIETISSDEPGGTVIWQSIPVNTMAEEWDTIKFQVSAGLAETTITQFYELPEPQGDATTVHVQVYVGNEDEPQYDETVKYSDGQVRVTLSGSGMENVRVYFDGALDQSQGGPTSFS